MPLSPESSPYQFLPERRERCPICIRMGQQITMYFAYDLPMNAPDYIETSKVSLFEQYIRGVAARMDKLEEALEISGLDGATFSMYAKVLFDSMPDRFDTMSSDELAEYVLTVYDGYTIAEPRLEWPNAITIVDTAFVREKEWQAIRRLSIGGSEAAIVTGNRAYNTPNHLYLDKRWALPETDKSQAVFDRGHIMEPRVIKAFCDTVGAEVVPETRMFKSKKYPECSANIDAIVRFPGNKLYVFEAKTTIAQNFQAWKAGKIPNAYVPQTRQYPAVLDDERILGTYIGCLFTVDYQLGGYYLGSDADVGQFVSRFVERDPLAEDSQLAMEAEFFRNVIQACEEPPLTGEPEKELETLSEYFGKADKSAPALELDDSFRDQIEEYLDIYQSKKLAESSVANFKEALKTLSLPLIQALGTSIEGRLPTGNDNEYFEVKYAPRSLRSVDYERMKVKYPEAFEECVSVDPCASRVFSITKKKKKK